jgi:hypothetical protein
VCSMRESLAAAGCSHGVHICKVRLEGGGGGWVEQKVDHRGSTRGMAGVLLPPKLDKCGFASSRGVRRGVIWIVPAPLMYESGQSPRRFVGNFGYDEPTLKQRSHGMWPEQRICMGGGVVGGRDGWSNGNDGAAIRGGKWGARVLVVDWQGFKRSGLNEPAKTRLTTRKGTLNGWVGGLGHL